MPPRKKVLAPQNVGFYISLADFSKNSYRSLENCVVYVRNHIGQWFASGTLVSEDRLPADLVQLGPVQP